MLDRDARIHAARLRVLAAELLAEADRIEGPQPRQPRPAPVSDVLLPAADRINVRAVRETGQPASIRRLRTELRIGQKRAQHLQQQLQNGRTA
jgi:hypothetical protein